jgi:hypothetical protein
VSGPERFRAALVRGWLSPAGLLIAAASVYLFFAVCHLAGLRELTPVISGTVPDTSLGHDTASALALVYAASYVLAVFACPVLTIGSLVLLVLRLVSGEASLDRPDHRV